jgi:hypothetical protein
MKGGVGKLSVTIWLCSEVLTVMVMSSTRSLLYARFYFCLFFQLYNGNWGTCSSEMSVDFHQTTRYYIPNELSVMLFILWVKGNSFYGNIRHVRLAASIPEHRLRVTNVILRTVLKSRPPVKKYLGCLIFNNAEETKRSHDFAVFFFHKKKKGTITISWRHNRYVVHNTTMIRSNNTGTRNTAFNFCALPAVKGRTAFSCRTQPSSVATGHSQFHNSVLVHNICRPSLVYCHLKERIQLSLCLFKHHAVKTCVRVEI